MKSEGFLVKHFFRFLDIFLSLSKNDLNMLAASFIHFFLLLFFSCHSML